MKKRFSYLSQEVMFSVLSVCLFVCHLAGLHKNYQTDFHETQWTNLKPIQFWNGSE